MATQRPAREGGDADAPSREEINNINTAIGDLSAKLDSLLTTVSQVVHGTTPTAEGGGGESRGGRHTAPGAEREELDQLPNTGGTGEPQLSEEELTSAVGNVTRASASGELPENQVHYTAIRSSRPPRMRQLNFDGKEESWQMFKNDFLTQVHACGMMSCLTDSRDISVHGMSDEQIVDPGLQYHEIGKYKELWLMLVEAITDNTTKMMVFSHKGPAGAWRELEENFASLTGGEQVSLIGKFFRVRQREGQEPQAFFQQFNSTVTSLEMVFDQPIPKMLVRARFLDALLPEYEIQKQQLYTQKVLEADEMLRVLRSRAGQLKVEKEGKRGAGRKPEHAFVAGGNPEVKQARRRKKKPKGGDTALAAGAESKGCFGCGDKSHFLQQCPKQFCQRCGGKGHHVKDCKNKVDFVGAVVEYDSYDEEYAIETQAF